MARKTKEESLVTRERLLDAAEALFRERGVTRTSLADVATGAGMTRGAVYWHFKDKADLFRAMCDRATLPLDANFERMDIDSRADPLGTLRTLSIAAMTSLATDERVQNVFEIVFHKSEMVDELAGLATSHRTERCACLAQIEDVIRRAALAGQLPADIDAALVHPDPACADGGDHARVGARSVRLRPRGRRPRRGGHVHRGDAHAAAASCRLRLLRRRKDGIIPGSLLLSWQAES